MKCNKNRRSAKKGQTPYTAIASRTHTIAPFQLKTVSYLLQAKTIQIFKFLFPLTYIWY